MKKLIAFMSSFVSIFSTASIVVACGTAKPQSGAAGGSDGTGGTGGTGGSGGADESKINKQLLNTLLTEDGIDGSILNVNNTGAEALYLIKKLITNIEPKVTNIKFVNTTEETNFLSKGDNHFKVSFDFKSENLTFPVIINDVQESNDLDENETEIYVNGILNDENILEIENKVSSKDNVENWKSIIGSKIREKVTNAAIDIVTYPTNQNELNVIIEIYNLPYGMKDITKQISYITDKTTNIKSTNPYQNMVKESLKKGIDVNNLNDKDTYENSLVLLNAFAKRFNSNVNVELKNKDQAKKLLKVGNNSIELLVNLQGYQPIQFTVSLKNVKSYVELEEVKKRYAKGKNFKQLNSSDTYESMISTYQKWIDNSFPNKGIKISLKDSSKLNQKIPESTIPIKVEYNQNGKKISGFIKPYKKELAFNVPGDGNCMFWSVVTAYLLLVKNNDEKTKERFQELFGKNELNHLTHVQTLLKEFNLENTGINKSFYEDEIVKELVAKKFRKKVVDYIKLVLKRNSNGEANALKPGILNDNNNNNNNNKSDDEFINDYLENMTKDSVWGGNTELTAVCFMLNCNIIIVRSDTLTETKIEPLSQNPSSSIKLHHIYENHYTYYLPDVID